MPRNQGLALGGWPFWHGSDETPRCPRCDEDLELFVQLDLSHALAATWGDAGILFAFVCPVHRDQFGVRMQDP
ncbi:MAG: hypothetical protein WKG01_18910 [Kofleriaceae bacterium]